MAWKTVFQCLCKELNKWYDLLTGKVNSKKLVSLYENILRSFPYGILRTSDLLNDSKSRMWCVYFNSECYLLYLKFQRVVLYAFLHLCINFWPTRFWIALYTICRLEADCWFDMLTSTGNDKCQMLTCEYEKTKRRDKEIAVRQESSKSAGGCWTEPRVIFRRLGSSKFQTGRQVQCQESVTWR